MLNKTIREFNRIVADAKAFSFLAMLITQCFFIAYYTVALCLPFGYKGVYGAMLGLTLVTLIYLCIDHMREDKKKKGHKWLRCFAVYAKICVHIVAISLSLYALYTTEPSELSVLSPILLIFAILALIIQITGELVGFLTKRYFKPLIDTAVEESEFLRTVIGKVQGGVESFAEAKERITSLPARTAKAARGLGARIKDAFHKRKNTVTDVAFEDVTDETINN